MSARSSNARSSNARSTDSRGVTRIAGIATAVLTSVLLVASAAAGPYDPPVGYYASVNTTSATTLRNTLHAIIDNHHRFPYSAGGTDTWDILDDADEDPNNPNNVLDVYKNASYPKAGAGNTNYDREHRWPKSLGFPSESDEPYTDCHMLAISNISYNGSRSNKPYGNCTSGCTERATVSNDGEGGTGPASSNYTNSDVWETWPGKRGDCARAIFYAAIRYEGDPGEPDLELTDTLSQIQQTSGGVAYMGLLSDLIQWHIEDPVDEQERKRNQVVYGYQLNRNPFVDHPEYVCLLWNSGSCDDGVAPAAPTSLAAVSGNGAVSLDWADNTEADFSSYRVYRSGTSGSGYVSIASNVNQSDYIDSTVSNGATYYYVVTALDVTARESTNSNQAIGQPFAEGSDFVPPSAPTGVVATPGDAQVDLSWAANGEGDLDGYRVLRATSAAGPFSLVATRDNATTSYHDTAVVNFTTYYYNVKAFDTFGDESAASATVEAKPTGGGIGMGELWINEIHYDNDATDAGEFIEIAGPAGADLTGWTISFYNGSTPASAATYGSALNLGTASLKSGGISTSIIPDLGNCLGVVYVDIPGLQNGGNDGMALVSPTSEVIQLLSYEGVFTASDGPAMGMTSTDIGVAEIGTTPVGQSLQLAGLLGKAYADFTWQAPATATKGTLNNGQTFGDVCFVPNEPPTVSINVIAPDPRTTAVASATIVFSEVVQNFDKSDLELLRDDATVALGAATLTSGDNKTFTLGSLAALTSTSGEYVLTLATSNIQDLVGAALVEGAVESWLIDNLAPVTEITAPTINLSNASGHFTILYDYTDAGIGTESIKLFYRKDAGAFTQYGALYDPTGDIEFDIGTTGGSGTYGLYTVGVDALGNEETAPGGGDGDVTVDLTMAIGGNTLVLQ